MPIADGLSTGKNADPAPQGGTPTVAGVEALAGQGVGGSDADKNADPAPKGCTPTVAGVEALETVQLSEVCFKALVVRTLIRTPTRRLKAEVQIRRESESASNCVRTFG